jgi:hypothetical protein
MKSLGLAQFALSSCAAAVMLVGCGGSQPPIGALGTVPQSRAPATHAERGGSWMLPEAKGRNLLYSAASSIVDVYTYPDGKLLGSLGAFDSAGFLCADKAGDVFVPSFDDHTVYEYAHGGTKQLAALNSPYSVNACSVDQKTQDVAASSYYGAIIFPYSRKKHKYGLAQYYDDSAVYLGEYCTYDGQGNLFEDGTAAVSGGFALSELPYGSKTFVGITVDQSINGLGAVQWRSNALTVADRGSNTSRGPAVIYAFKINGSVGTKVGKTPLSGSTAYAQFWIQGKRVVGPESGSKGLIGIWQYPAGGYPRKSILGSPPYGVVVSLK